MPAPSRFTLATPSDFVLRRDLCSYGYFLLEPNHWDPRESTFRTTLGLERGAATVIVAQSGKRGSPLSVRADRPLSRSEVAAAKASLTRIMRLDEPAHTIAVFHRIDPRWKKLGRGRLMRSESFFQDVIRTVTSCNVTWPSTCTMNRRLCEVVGERSRSGFYSFPSPRKLARVRPASLRARCSVGYRDARIVELARMFARGEVDPAWFEDPARTDDELHEALLELPGIGPYAAANIMQLLGRYSRLPLDTESVRHGKAVLGMAGTQKAIMKRLHAHYEPFGEHRFRSYWFELWEFYEQKRQAAWTWEKDTTGRTFTAALL